MIPLSKFLTAAGVFAGFSLVMSFWLVICSGVMAWLCWQHRDRLTNWPSLSLDERADFCLNWGLFLFFVHASLNRAQASYSYATHIWDASSKTQPFVAWYLPLALVGLSMILMWMMFHTARRRWRWYWCLWMWSGLALFIGLMLFVEA